MHKLEDLFLQALKSTSSQKRWWILAIGQSLCLIYIAWLHPYKPQSMLAVALFCLISGYFWADIKAVYVKKVETILTRDFIKKVFLVFIDCYVVFWLFVFLDSLKVGWIAYSVITSVILGTLVISLFSIVLFRVNLADSWRIAIAAWSSKISLAAISAFVLMLCKAFYFMTLTRLLEFFYSLREFSVLFGSATIWMLLMIALIFVSFFSALLNSFLVILFLENLKPVKDQEEQKLTDPIIAPELNT
jgi:hypothetical protein